MFGNLKLDFRNLEFESLQISNASLGQHLRPLRDGAAALRRPPAANHAAHRPLAGDHQEQKRFQTRACFGKIFYLGILTTILTKFIGFRMLLYAYVSLLYD